MDFIFYLTFFCVSIHLFTVQSRARYRKVNKRYLGRNQNRRTAWYKTVIMCSVSNGQQYRSGNMKSIRVHRLSIRLIIEAHLRKLLQHKYDTPFKVEYNTPGKSYRYLLIHNFIHIRNDDTQEGVRFYADFLIPCRYFFIATLRVDVTVLFN